jgi:hypothetical protein
MKDYLKKHHLNLLVVAGFILGVAATLGSLQFDFMRRFLVPSSGNGVFSARSAAPAAAPAYAPIAAASPRSAQAPLPAATPDQSAEIAGTQAAVESYMRKYLPPGAALSVIEWRDFVISGDASAISLHYRVVKQNGDNVEARVRFIVQGGSVVTADVIAPPAPPIQSAAPPQAAPPPQAAAPPPQSNVIDHFTAPLQAAMNGPQMTMEPNNAYSLSQLDQAKQEAQLVHKPIGFIMVWGQFFDQPEGPRDTGSVSALVHFYQVFHQNLVLVFVRHESELALVPPAVKEGYGGPDEGGYAPNMAVTDATASEFIVEIPFKNLDAPGRDQLFAAGGHKIDQWLATHPTAMAIPASEGP